jgi:phage-related protein
MKSVYFIGSAHADLKRLPGEVQKDIGFALYEAQLGGKSFYAKPLKAFHGAGVLEILDDFGGDTYRAVYTVRFSEVIYVLHVFQKKSKHGVALPKTDAAMIETRLKLAEKHSKKKEK